MKQIKVISLVLVIFIITLTCVGCSKELATNKKTTSTENTNVLHCTRNATASDNTETSLKYSIYYDGDYVTKTVSVEKVTSSDESILTSYKESYERVFEPYKNIDYYENTVSKTNDSVITTTVINYEKVDVSKIIAIEGEDDNIFESNGKVKKDNLVSLFKKYGATCK